MEPFWGGRRFQGTVAKLPLLSAFLSLATVESRWAGVFQSTVTGIPFVNPIDWEAPPMDEHQYRGRFLTNFQRHWSVQMPPESKAPRHWSIRVPLKFTWTNGSQISLKVLVYTGIGPWSALLWSRYACTR